MADLLMKADVPPVPRKRRLVPRLFLLLFVILAALSIEHWRGERALRAWKTEMTAQGEILDPNRLWPTPAPSSREFCKQLAEAVGRLPKSLTQFFGGLPGLSQDELGRPSRGSQQARPPLSHEQHHVPAWEEWVAARQEAQPALETIRKLMRNPPRAMDTQNRRQLDPSESLYYSKWRGTVRASCQALHAAVITDLHRGDLAAALENLEALQGCVRVNADDQTLLSYIYRVAILGLASDACWDALQEDRWTEAQLLRLQEACQSHALFPQIPEVMAGERVDLIQSMDWFASHSYQTWIGLFTDIHRGFGSKAPEMNTANWNGLWRQWIFHPAWSYAWRAQDELDFLRFSQRDMDIVREAVNRRSWFYLKERQTELRNNYRRPFADWRFYRPLPLYDIMIDMVVDRRMEPPQSPYPDFSRAWFVAVKTLARHEMVTAVIALKRCQLREGNMPPDLAALVPDYLDDLPRDLVDGQPLRYWPTPEGGFVLYSVGEDARDDGGDARPSKSSATQQRPDPWSGRDWVWPQAPAGGVEARIPPTHRPTNTTARRLTQRDPGPNPDSRSPLHRSGRSGAA